MMDVRPRATSHRVRSMILLRTHRGQRRMDIRRVSRHTIVDRVSLIVLIAEYLVGIGSAGTVVATYHADMSHCRHSAIGDLSHCRKVSLSFDPL